MAESKMGYVDVGGGKVYYEMEGTGEPLILCHAGFVDSGMWDSQWKAFTGRYRVIRFDMRGYGKSDKATGPVSRRRDLYAVLQHLRIERAHLLGCSMGGEIVLDFMLDHPEMVSSLILVSAAPGGFQMQGEPPPHMLEMIGAVQQGDLTRASELQIKIWVDGAFRQPEQVDPHVRDQAAQMNRIALSNGTWGVADSQPLEPLDPPAIGRLHEIHCPVLVIVGALDHPEILRAADVIVAAIPGSKKVILTDCAHVPNMEKPGEFNQAVLSFLQPQ